MRQLRTTVLVGASAFLFLAMPACAPDSGSDGDGGSGGGTTSSAASSVYRGTYEVPVAPELAAAAVYDVAEVEWTIVNGSVKLEYDLPLGLVGKDLRVEFTGPIDLAAGTAKLVGPPGDATCVLTSTTVSCTEQMNGLLPIAPDLAVVEQIAKTQFAGAASLRVDVAKQFSVDPIGIVLIDLNDPAVEPGETD